MHAERCGDGWKRLKGREEEDKERERWELMKRRMKEYAIDSFVLMLVFISE